MEFFSLKERNAIGQIVTGPPSLACLIKAHKKACSIIALMLNSGTFSVTRYQVTLQLYYILLSF